ncbi:MAG: hypothetical protein ACI4SB_03810, partial [Acutalibacteraceae bacterium]
MAKIKLVHFELVALLQDSKKLMDYLQKVGMTEIEKTENEEVTHLDTDGIVRQLEGFYNTADGAKTLIERYCNIKLNLMQTLHDYKYIEYRD